METSSETAPLSGPAIMGLFLQALANLRREPSTDILVTQSFLQADARALQSREFRSGLASCLAALRYPLDEEARAQDVGQWLVLLSEPLGEQLLIDARLTPEQRAANLSYFLLRPELPLALLAPYGGNLTSATAHEAQLALQALPAEQVAPIARFPAALVPRYPELAALPQPVDAQGLSVLVPHVLRPDQAARLLSSLAEEIHAAAQGDSPVAATRQAFATAAAEGLRALASRLEPETLPQQVAQLLVLGGLQHQAFFQNLPLFTEDALARREQPPGAVSAVDGAARQMISTSVSLIGMAMGGPIGMAAAEMILRSVWRAVDAAVAGGRLPLGALTGEVLGVPGLGTAPQGLSALISALTQLYTAQLAALVDRAPPAVEELLPRLLQGGVEGLGEAWAAWLGAPSQAEFLQLNDDEDRALVLRVLLVGGAVGAFSWESLAPALLTHGQLIFGHALPAETPAATAAGLFASSAARAVAVLANDELFYKILAEELSPAEALAEAQDLGASLFVGGAEPADPALTAAMLGALAPPGTLMTTDVDTSPDADNSP